LRSSPSKTPVLRYPPVLSTSYGGRYGLSHLQTILRPQGRIVGRLKFIVVFKIKTLNIMTLPFVGFTSQKRPLKFLTCDLLLATCDFPLHA